LWPFFDGTIKRPDTTTLFIPQTPFVTSGTLIDQIVFPLRYSSKRNIDVNQGEVLAILKLVELDNLLKDTSIAENMVRISTLTYGNLRRLRFLITHKIDKMINWGDEETHINFRSLSNREWIENLSPGEQQRLSMARVLFHKPQLAFLDEISSSVSTNVEAKFYVACKQRGINVVSIGHRESLMQHHDYQLALEQGFRWDFKALRDEVPQL
jgi:ATP-binding cassette subfamily D (ALD) long-chain fatty acid import protein